MSYKIRVKTIQGNQLTFTVSQYSVSDGDFVCFIDTKTGKEKKFHASNCEIEVFL